jgi:hypothetical protein
MELDDLVRGLNVLKQQEELLGSRLLRWNFLAESTRISIFGKRNYRLSTFYDMQGSLCDIQVSGLMEQLVFGHKPEE